MSILNKFFMFESLGHADEVVGGWDATIGGWLASMRSAHTAALR
jgi:hypothetical protein